MEEASNNLVMPPASTPVPKATTEATPSRKKPEELKPMNFKVPPAFKRAYKQFALDHDMSLVEVLKQSFEVFKGTK